MSVSVTLWRKLEEAGLAGEVCDAIVRTQPVPDRLLRALAATRVVSREPAARVDIGRAALHEGSLSSAEVDVLEAAACGFTAGETARNLHRSPDTVKIQRRRAMSKMGARNITHAVALHLKAFGG